MKKTTTLEHMFKVLSEGLSVAAMNSIRILSSISVKITTSRIERKMNQTEFAKFMGVSQGMISKWESGDYNFTIKQLCEVCEKLDITPKIEFQTHDAVTEYTPLKKEFVGLDAKSGQANTSMNKNVFIIREAA